MLFESAIADLPADLRWLYESGAVSLEQLALLHEQRGVTALADLAAAIDLQAIRSVDGLDETVERAVAAALPNLRAAIPRIPLGRAVGLVDPILNHLRALPGIDWALPVGSLRRAQDMVGDIEIVAAAADPSPALDAIVGLPGRRSGAAQERPARLPAGEPQPDWRALSRRLTTPARPCCT